MNLHLSKPALLLLLLVWQSETHPRPVPSHFQYQRSLTISSALPSVNKQICAVLDAPVFAHSLSSLKDLRLYSGKTELPFATTLSEPLQRESEDARILNLGIRSGHITFDLKMPHRAYTGVVLDLDGSDFVATAMVSGSEEPAARPSTSLESSTLFDLTSQHLSRNTRISIAESTFAYLHLDLAVSPAPGNPATAASLQRSIAVRGATVPPSREAQTLYTTAQQTESLVQRGRQSVAAFEVPRRVPVERISFLLNPRFKGSFSRSVGITARQADAADSVSAGSPGPNPTAEDGPADETASGNIFRVHTVEAGHEISDEELSISAALGSNMQRRAAIEVAIENGDDPPLPVAAVQLEMRQRRICFETPVHPEPITVYYGDPALEAPVYDYASLFQPAAAPSVAQLGPESPNPSFVSRGDSRPFTDQHPELLWIALLGVVCVLALTAIRSAKKLR